jgi:hypothetical protein
VEHSPEQLDLLTHAAERRAAADHLHGLNAMLAANGAVWGKDGADLIKKHAKPFERIVNSR